MESTVPVCQTGTTDASNDIIIQMHRKAFKPETHTHTYSPAHRNSGSLQEYHLYMLQVQSMLFLLRWCHVASPASVSSSLEEKVAQMQTDTLTQRNDLFGLKESQHKDS